MKDGTFLFLGTGGSMGVPVIGCHCSVCTSESPCNIRLRPSGLITFDKKNFLVDCGPDYHAQALHYHIEHLDGLIITHAHHDHIAGIDELRAYFMHGKATLPCLLSESSLEEIKVRYPYIFNLDNIASKLTPKLDLTILKGPKGELLFQGLPIQYDTYEQTGMLVNGYRFGNFAYFSDLKHYSESIFETLKGVHTLVISALRFAPSPAHLSIDDAIQFAKKSGAKQTWLTHIAHELDHEKTNAYLPANIRMAYDGLTIPLQIHYDN